MKFVLRFKNPNEIIFFRFENVKMQRTLSMNLNTIQCTMTEPYEANE